LAAAGFQVALFVLLHDLMDFAFAGEEIVGDPLLDEPASAVQ